MDPAKQSKLLGCVQDAIDSSLTLTQLVQAIAEAFPIADFPARYGSLGTAISFDSAEADIDQSSTSLPSVSAPGSAAGDDDSISSAIQNHHDTISSALALIGNAMLTRPILLQKIGIHFVLLRILPVRLQSSDTFSPQHKTIFCGVIPHLPDADHVLIEQITMTLPIELFNSTQAAANIIIVMVQNAFRLFNQLSQYRVPLLAITSDNTFITSTGFQQIATLMAHAHTKRSAFVLQPLASPSHAATPEINKTFLPLIGFTQFCSSMAIKPTQVFHTALAFDQVLSRPTNVAAAKKTMG
jgi:hypothetical protein